MTLGSAVVLTRRGFGETSRRDAWWLYPVAVFLGLSAFIVYATGAAFQGEHYYVGPYLSPFYSPELFGDSAHRWFGPEPGWWAPTKCCTTVCPEHITITDNAIIPLKERVVDRYYDPVTRLLRLVRKR